MDIDEMKRAAIRIRGGVGNAPETRWFDTHYGQPEVVDINETNARDRTVYIPTESFEPYRDDSTYPPTMQAFRARTYISTVQIVERVEVDVSDPLHPVINIYGYKRVYRARVWMTDDEASAVDRITDDRDSAESEA